METTIKAYRPRDCPDEEERFLVDETTNDDPRAVFFIVDLALIDDTRVKVDSYAAALGVAAAMQAAFRAGCEYKASEICRVIGARFDGGQLSP